MPSQYEFHGDVFIGAIGRDAHAFRANGPITMKQTGHLTWLETTSTIVHVDDIEVDMTDVPEGQRRRVGGHILVRTETGVKARRDPQT